VPSAVKKVALVPVPVSVRHAEAQRNPAHAMDSPKRSKSAIAVPTDALDAAPTRRKDLYRSKNHANADKLDAPHVDHQTRRKQQDLFRRKNRANAEKLAALHVDH
jgi:hypothetical protein